MLKKIASVLCLTILFSTSFSGLASTDSYDTVIKQLNNLLKLKDYAKAYEYGDTHTYEFGGDAEFDLLVGLAAFGSDKHQEAVFAFERVLLTKPGSFLGRFYLALSYQKVDNLHASIKQLEELLSRPITVAQREKSEALLQRVENQLLNRNRSWYQLVGASLAYDNNINAGTDEDTAVSPVFGEILLFDSSKQTADLSYTLNYMAGYQHPISQYQWLKLDVTASYFNYAQKTEYQRFVAGFNVAYEQELLDGKVSIAGFSRPLWREIEKLNTEQDLNYQPPNGTTEKEIGPYRTESGVAFSFQKSTTRSINYRLGVNYSKIANDISPQLDMTRTKLSAAIQYKTKLLHTVIGHWQEEVADDSNGAYNGKDALGVTYQVTWPITSTLVSNSYVLVENQKYKGPHPLFLKTRDETMTALSSQLLFNSSEKLQLKFSVAIQNKVSNLTLFSYDRIEVAGSWQYRF